MRKLSILALLLLITAIGSAQAYDGKGDLKLQIGANFQNNGSGIMTSLDYGLGENFSIGAASTYLLGVNEIVDADFSDRIDLKAKFNANLGSVFQLGDNVDIYPGLNLGLKNFGGHLGARYFFTDGFGVFTELQTPIAKYKTEDLTAAEKLHNQFTINIGASFNIQ
ncbi:DUF6646 family protein [Kriegella aquimaris]|uniref:Outer membrane protein beta-barrel domain-containing protein n=1 Tax=Kriegella aquimaris TaxID=192904 RepID=A0A1G9M168_9FLAO|nr:DUF6646 family protein [Kriegella aquimaris]SDL68022.1 hypothetical protein SAMN04488514_102314 [Kriegella aquimaris]